MTGPAEEAALLFKARRLRGSALRIMAGPAEGTALLFMARRLRGALRIMAGPAEGAALLFKARRLRGAPLWFTDRPVEGSRVTIHGPAG